MLLALTPGVIFTQEQFGASGFSGTRGWDTNNGYKINGGRPGTSIFLLNGAPITDKDGNWEISPNIEAVQEFKVMTNVYDAQYGRMAGGVVNTTSRADPMPGMAMCSITSETQCSTPTLFRTIR